ncbi:hypothetical protein PIB30_109686 [Stylosanthes scabra]|uniref:Uncharacterized protein n=1 Tax=Stylosanthes scabra TaxID=79078 RepID=A0ABU6R162_9FABA|nr:hypothetical protein [Stylosanthes scabra]
MEEKRINLPRVLKDAVHKVHAGKRQSLTLPCLIMKIAHSNRIHQRPGDEMFHIPRAARTSSKASNTTASRLELCRAVVTPGVTRAAQN